MTKKDKLLLLKIAKNFITIAEDINNLSEGNRGKILDIIQGNILPQELTSFGEQIINILEKEFIIK